jgi:hypothetical protein
MGGAGTAAFGIAAKTAVRLGLVAKRPAVRVPDADIARPLRLRLIAGREE